MSDERALLAEPPTPLGRNGAKHVNEPQSEAEELALRSCIARGKPFGSEKWTKKIAGQLHLESTLRPAGGRDNGGRRARGGLIVRLVNTIGAN